MGSELTDLYWLDYTAPVEADKRTLLPALKMAMEACVDRIRKIAPQAHIVEFLARGCVAFQWKESSACRPGEQPDPIDVQKTRADAQLEVLLREVFEHERWNGWKPSVTRRRESPASENGKNGELHVETLRESLPAR